MSRFVFDHPKFQCWKRRIDASGIILKNIDILATISRNQTSLFGVFLDCKLLTPEGFEIPRCVMIHGDSSVIVPVLTCQDDGEIYTLMVEQRRIVNGEYNEEFPAGSVDMMEEDPVFMACQEIQEELHLDISPEDLIPLRGEPIKINPSLNGDVAYFYYFEKTVTFEFLKEIDYKDTGCHEEFEHIRVRVHKMAEVSKLSTSSALIGLKLLESKLCRIF